MSLVPTDCVVLSEHPPWLAGPPQEFSVQKVDASVLGPTSVAPGLLSPASSPQVLMTELLTLLP